MLRFLAGTLKIAVASLLAGAALSLFDISSAQILESMGLTPAALWDHILRATAWAVPNMVLGSMIIVPMWFLTYIFLPPRD